MIGNTIQSEGTRMKENRMKSGKRQLAYLLACTMVAQLCMPTSLAGAVERKQEKVQVITAFTEIPKDVKNITIPLGADEAAVEKLLAFPETVEATVVEEWRDTKATSSNADAASGSDTKRASDSDAEKASDSDANDLNQADGRCICDEVCDEENINKDCPVCKEDYTDCAAYDETSEEDVLNDIGVKVELPVTWKLDTDPDKSVKDTFDAGQTPEQYFGLDEDGKVNYDGASEEKKAAWVDMTGAYYTYTAVLPTEDEDGNSIVLAEGVKVPEILVVIGEPEMETMAAGEWVYPVTAPTPTWTGSGTKGEPYVITTAQQLADLSYLVNDGRDYGGKYFELRNDIDLKSQEWTPIGLYQNDERPFSGILNGNDFTILGLSISNECATGTGLFGYLGEATVKNLNVECEISGNSGFVGGITGVAAPAVIENCMVSGTMSTSAETSTAAFVRIGGMVGFGIADVTDCTNNASISGGHYTGGIFGQCFASGTAYYCTIRNCVNNGNVESKIKNDFAGGIAGQIYKPGMGYIYNCINTGGVQGVTDETVTSKVGGIIGENAGHVYNSLNLGTVTGYGYIGSVVGDQAWIVKDSYSTTGEAAIGYIWENPTYGNKVAEAYLADEATLTTGELAWKLNQDNSGESTVNSAVWSQGDTQPVFANDELPAVYRALFMPTEGETPIAVYYLKAGDTINPPADYEWAETIPNTMPAEDVVYTATVSAYVASVTVGETITYHQTLEQAISKAEESTDATIQLLQDVTVDQTIILSASGNGFTLDLNGKKLDLGENHIDSSSSLTVTDTNTEKKGTITGSSSSSPVIEVQQGSFTLKGGNILGETAVSQSEGTLNITGGTLTTNVEGGTALDLSNCTGTTKLTGGTYAIADGVSSGMTILTGGDVTDILVKGYGYYAGRDITGAYLDFSGGQPFIKQTVTVGAAPAATVTDADGTLIGNYGTLSAAVEAANNAETNKAVTITVKKDDESDSASYNFTRTSNPIILDLGGAKVSTTQINVDGSNLTIQNGTVKGTCVEQIILSKSGTLTLGKDASLNCDQGVAVYNEGADVIIDGAVLEGSTGKTAMTQVGGTLTVNSGTFKGQLDIQEGTAKLKGGSYAAASTVSEYDEPVQYYGINLLNGTVGELLDEGYSYKNSTTNEWVTDAEILGGKTISSVTVERIPLAITGQPVGGELNATTTSIDLTVTAVAADTSAQISYQWYKGSVEEDNKIDKATSATYTATEVGDYLCTVTCGDNMVTSNAATVFCYVASVKKDGEAEQKYASLDDAFDKALDGSTITMLADTTMDYKGVYKNLTLDLKGKTVTVAMLSANYALAIGSGGSLTIQDSSDDQDGILTNQPNQIMNSLIYVNDGTLTVKSGNLKAVGAGATAVQVFSGGVANLQGGAVNSAILVVNVAGGTLNISGGYYEGVAYSINEQLKSAVQLTGGTFANGVYALSTADSFLAPGYCYYAGKDTTGNIVDGSGPIISQMVTVGATPAATVTDAEGKRVGDGYYDSLDKALAAANSDTSGKTLTVTVKKNTSTNDNITLTRTSAPILLDLGGKTVTGTLTLDGAALTLQNGTLMGAVTVQSGTLSVKANCVLNSIGGVPLVIKGGAVTIDADVEGDKAVFTTYSSNNPVIDQTAGTLVVNGGAFKNGVSFTGGITTLKGGSFSSINVPTGKTVAQLLDSGYAYKNDDTWMTDADTLNSSTLTGMITVQQIPLSVTAQPTKQLAKSYGYTQSDDLTLSVTAALQPADSGKIVSYQWSTSVNGGTATAITDNGNSSSYTIPTGLGIGTYTYSCAVTCDGFTVNSDSTKFTVGKADQAALSITDVTGKVYKDADFALTTTGGSGTGAVSFSVPADNGVLSITGDAANGYTATILSTGTVKVTAVKADDGNYNQAMAEREITIGKADAPDLTFPTAAALNYGQTLENSALTGGSTSYGTFAWTDTSVVPDVVNSGYDVTFTPSADTTKNYKDFTTEQLKKKVAIDVTTKTIDISGMYWSTDPLTYTGSEQTLALLGTLPTEVKLVNRTGDKGTDAGSYSASVGFEVAYGYTATNYTISGNDNPLTKDWSIGKAAAPSITFPAASALTYGQTLASSTLTGGSTDFGTFAWTDSTLVPAVTNTGCEVTFTPSASTIKNYNTIVAENLKQNVTVVVGKTDQTALSITDVTGKLYGDAAFALSTTGGSGTGAVSFSVPADNGVLSITGDAANGYTATILSAGTVKVTAVKEADGNYNQATAEKEITIGKAAAPSITFPTAGSLTYGQTLESSALTGGSTSYGTFAWTDTSVVPDVVNSGYDVTFTPSADTAKNYEAYTTEQLTKKVAIDVTAKTIDISGMHWSNDPLTYTGSEQILALLGTLPAELKLSAQSGNKGTDAGDYHASVTFAIADDLIASNYVITGTVLLEKDWNIRKAAAPKLTWPTAGEIYDDQTLALSALTGGSTKLGTFAWSDDSVIPAAGKHSYTVVFTPSEATKKNYEAFDPSELSATVTVNVLERPKLNNTTTEVAVAPAAVEDAPANASEDVKEIVEALKSPTTAPKAEGLDAVADSVIGTDETGQVTVQTGDTHVTGTQAVEALEKKNISTAGKETKLVVEPYIQVKVQDIVTEGDKTVLVMDIKAMYNVKATTATSTEDMVEAGTEQAEGKAVNTVTIGTGYQQEVSEPVTLSIPLPKNFVKENLFIRHTHDGTVSYYEVTVEDDMATFVNEHGFSKFELLSDTQTGTLVFDSGVTAAVYNLANVGDELPVAVKSGYTFNGWNIGGTTYTMFTLKLLELVNAASDKKMTATAVFTKNSSGSGSGSGGSGGSSSAASRGAGWNSDATGNWKYYEADGSYVKNAWRQVNENGVLTWYHFGADGNMNTGWFLDVDGSWYYLNPISDGTKGAMKTGWYTDLLDNYRYYLDPKSGKMAVGWVLIDGVWYYFNDVVSEASGWYFDQTKNQWAYDPKAQKPLGAVVEGAKR